MWRRREVFVFRRVDEAGRNGLLSNLGDIDNTNLNSVSRTEYRAGTLCAAEGGARLDAAESWPHFLI